MGWTYTTRRHGESIREFFERIFNYQKEDGTSGTIIESSVVRFKTAYFAYKICTPGNPDKVIALVCLLDYRPHDFPYDFGYKDMDEDMGPCEDKCPEKILKLLTPTDSEYAKAWRKRCWDNINARKAAPTVKKNQWVKFVRPLRFQCGTVRDVLQYIGRNRFRDSFGFLYRLQWNWRTTNQFWIVENPS